ncbi:MAG: tRNA adenosine(34) deaminase TadA [Firmicutes bacterium]|nr:tRNA adenosine(34) deaminase TadA [Bacillota bacterium]
MDYSQLESFMREALAEAEKALELGEVPVGAILVRDGEVISRAHNRREELGDPTAHAEILAIRRAARSLGTWRLARTTLFVTLEPCPMCAGALVQARVDTVVFGARDPKAWGTLTVRDVAENAAVNHQAKVISGVLEEECQAILRRFFQLRR